MLYAVYKRSGVFFVGIKREWRGVFLHVNDLCSLCYFLLFNVCFMLAIFIFVFVFAEVPSLITIISLSVGYCDWLS